MQEVILNFHGLGTAPPHVNADEQPYWLTTERFIAILRLAQTHETEHRRIRVTFDDGNQSDAAVALPILKEVGRQASFFLLSDYIGKPGFVGQPEIAELTRAGMAIGSHGAAHVRWTTLSDVELMQQLTRSLRLLSGLAGEPVTCVAVPFGNYNRRVLKVLRRAGVSQVLTSDGGPTNAGGWIRARTTIRMDTPLQRVEMLLSDRLSPMDRLKFLCRRWIRRLR